MQQVKSVRAIQLEERAMADLLAAYQVEDPGEETVAVRRSGTSLRSSLPSSPIDSTNHAVLNGRQGGSRKRL